MVDSNRRLDKNQGVCYIENMRIYLRLLGFLKPHAWILAVASGFMLLASCFDAVSLGMVIPLVDRILAGRPIALPASVTLPTFLQSLIDHLNRMPAVELLNRLTIVLIILFFVKGMLTFLQSFLMSAAGHRVVRDVREVIYRKLLTLPPAFFDHQQTGGIVSRMTYDASMIQNAVAEGVTEFVYQTSQLLAYLALVLIVRSYFSISWWLLAVSLLLVPTVIYPVVRVGERLRQISTASAETMADINTALYETISGIKVVKIFMMEPYELRRFVALNRRFYRIMMKSVKRLIGVGPITEFIGILCFAIVLWFGGRSVALGELSGGAFIAFLAALLSLIRPFKRISKAHNLNQQAIAAAVRIFDLLDQPVAVVDPTTRAELESTVRTVRYEQVSFGYDARRPVLSDINLEVSAGEVIGLVGRSGAGKTTLVNLLPRLYDPTGGRILINGLDIRSVTIASLRRQIGIVSQEATLFHDTVRANILYGRIGASHDEVMVAAQAANAHDFILRLPHGYDTVIGERGYLLSGGERQRLTIARALLKDPPILILDEATSQLDTESERLVQEAIDRLLQGRTVFLIAHRLSTIRHAHRILVIEGGRIVEEGTHEMLLQAGGVYKRLYALQFQGQYAEKIA